MARSLHRSRTALDLAQRGMLASADRWSYWHDMGALLFWSQQHAAARAALSAASLEAPSVPWNWLELARVESSMGRGLSFGLSRREREACLESALEHYKLALGLMERRGPSPAGSDRSRLMAPTREERARAAHALGSLREERVRGRSTRSDSSRGPD